MGTYHCLLLFVKSFNHLVLFCSPIVQFCLVYMHFLVLFSLYHERLGIRLSLKKSTPHFWWKQVITTLPLNGLFERKTAKKQTTSIFYHVKRFACIIGAVEYWLGSLVPCKSIESGCQLMFYTQARRTTIRRPLICTWLLVRHPYSGPACIQDHTRVPRSDLSHLFINTTCQCSSESDVSPAGSLFPQLKTLSSLIELEWRGWVSSRRSHSRPWQLSKPYPFARMLEKVYPAPCANSGDAAARLSPTLFFAGGAKVWSNVHITTVVLFDLWSAKYMSDDRRLFSAPYKSLMWPGPLSCGYHIRSSASVSLNNTRELGWHLPRRVCQVLILMRLPPGKTAGHRQFVIKLRKITSPHSKLFFQPQLSSKDLNRSRVLFLRHHRQSMVSYEIDCWSPKSVPTPIVLLTVTDSDLRQNQVDDNQLIRTP